MHLLGSWRTNFDERHQLYRTSPQHLFATRMKAHSSPLAYRKAYRASLLGRPVT